MNRKAIVATAVATVLLAFGALAQQQTPTLDQLKAMPPAQVKAVLAANPALFLKVMRTTKKWDEAAEPTKVAGPIYFVGTQGLSVWLITGSQGHILMNTGMEGSGPLIEASIRKLGFNPKDIKWLLAGHSHVDHVGGHAYMKKLTGAQVATAAEEVGQMESGGKGTFNYDGVPGFSFEPVKVDRVLRDGDVITLGDLKLTALVTPGHNIGSITWIMEFVEGGKVYTVVFPDGAGANPGYRIVKNPSYPGIEGDFRNTLHVLEMLKPDIWLASHTESMDFDGKRARAKTAGTRAWVDPEGYRKMVASAHAEFEATVNAEMSAGKGK